MIEGWRALFVGAHCDDVELFAGGLLARCCLRGAAAVGVLTFSDHRGVVSDALAAQARAEMRANLEELAARAGREIFDHSGEMMAACSGALQARRAELYAALEALREDYDLVVTHSVHDTNQDHRQVAEEVRRVFKAHATVLEGEFPNNDLGEFRATYYVELSREELELKRELIAAYSSQRFGGRPYFDASLVEGLARMRGAQIRRRYAEAFQVGARVIV
ncbi:PIG-L family deacetylase [Pseudenhygromyxa sp. WMMC2535]|uniref:PIG-L family deacetylase n=1 Tax=Pseudenhygromyxa sp. WMMC2535 TaxID=2712867 RepID=UPI001558003B|nr:PIG-L family deacetylase [Pseudenhygromyxa sp. WMMC2535]